MSRGLHWALLVVAAVVAAPLAATAGNVATDPVRSATKAGLTGLESSNGLGPGTMYLAKLNGSNEVPSVDTRAQGIALFKLDNATMTVRYKLIASNIDNVIMAHIHRGCAGANGPILVWLYPVGGPPAADPGAGRTSGILAVGNFSVTSDLVGELDGGCLYVNVHTNDGADPVNTGAGDMASGEIRGQVLRAD